MPPPEPWEITDFQTAAGSHPLRAFLSRLTEDEKATAIALIQLLRERGNTLRRPHSGSLGNALFELRDVSSGIRVFYTFLGGRQAVLLGGLVKKRGDIPVNKLKEARKRCAAARAHSRRE